MTGLDEAGRPSRRGLLMTAVVAVLVALAIHKAFLAPAPPAHAAPYRFPKVDREAVIRFYRQQAARDPEDYRYPALLGNELVVRARETGDEQLYPLAEAAARESLRLNARPDAPAWPVLARVALARHDFKGAIKAAKDALAGMPIAHRSAEQEAVAELTAIVCDAELALGDVKGAEESVAAIMSIARSQYALTRHAQTQILRGLDDEALRTLEAACQADSPLTPESSAWVRTLMGSIHLAHGRLEDARAAYDESLQVLPEYWLANLRLAELDALEDKPVAAAARYANIAVVNSAIAVSPLVMTLRADMEARRGDRELASSLRTRAEVTWRQALRFGNTGHRRDFARFLLKRGEPADVSEALELARDEAQLRRDPDTLETLGWALLSAKKPGEAREVLGEALAPGYRRGVLLFLAGQAELAAGDHERGLRLLKEALGFGRGLPEDATASATSLIRRG